VKELGVDRVPSVLREGRREPTVILLYRSTCPACQKVVPYFTGFVEQTQKARDKVRFVAFSTDPHRRTIEHYVSAYEFPFDVWWLVPWLPGELVAAFRKAGITLPDPFGVPYFIVLDPGGKVVAQWSGEYPDLRRLRGALAKARGK
jgi:thiol-disulfide isomerase/thioredoxin